jgi:phage FluMu protein Com
VQTEAVKLSAPKADADPDIFFRCEHCNTSLVVNRAAAGMSLRCQRCDKLTAVPKPSEPAAGDLARLQRIQRRLTENESQRTEATSYINQLNIQLHRWQLRLQTLNERKQQLEKELALVKA